MQETKINYLDNAATTQVCPQVLELIAKTMQNHFANPSSLYGIGMQAENVIANARKQIISALGMAETLNSTRPQVIFTATGSEANNIAVLGIARAKRNQGLHIIATGYEHPSVFNPLKMLQNEGFLIDYVMPDENGNISVDEMASLVCKNTVLVCAMQVNNETGAIINVQELAKKVKIKNNRTAVHVDGVQGFCKLPKVLQNSEIDSYAVAGHKLHAPKGIGALYMRQNLQVLPPIMGGAQEGKMRPGTENTPYIAGFGLAAMLASESLASTQKQISNLNLIFKNGLQKMGGVVINSPQNAYEGILNFSLQGIKSEVMLHFLEKRGVYVSSGSACSKGQASHTLSAMKLNNERLESALRVSFCKNNDEQDVQALLEGLQEGISLLAKTKTASQRR